jgi:N-acetylmuramoyl-L-alanine amidase
MSRRSILKAERCALVLAISGLVWHFAVSEARGAPKILALRHWSAPMCTRVVVDLSGETEFRASSSTRPPLVTVEVKGSITEGMGRVFPIQDMLVSQARLTADPPHGVRIALELKKEGLVYHAFLLPRVEDRPVRLVIDVENPILGQQIQEERRTVQRDKAGKSRVRVVVIDPGHGGEDPGAIGPKGTMEKDVVLSIARALHRRLCQAPGVRAFLTRDGDYFLDLRQRVRVAQEYGADLFMSIHADASPNPGTRGASVYCLSLKGATDEAARILAERENASDLVGGVRLSGDQDLSTILLDMVQTQTINDSLKCGGIVLREIGNVQAVKFSAPRQAGFRVLKAPDTPSILVEVGFITNWEEEALLRNPSFQDRVAHSLERSALLFLGQQSPEPPSRPAHVDGPKPKQRTHVVRRGESLSQIAGLYNTSVGEIKRANQMKDLSRIQPGQRLLIP